MTTPPRGGRSGFQTRRKSLMLPTPSMVSSWAVVTVGSIEALLESAQGTPEHDVARARRGPLATDSTNEESPNQPDRDPRVLFHDPVPGIRNDAFGHVVAGGAHHRRHRRAEGL